MFNTLTITNATQVSITRTIVVMQLPKHEFGLTDISWLLATANRVQHANSPPLESMLRVPAQTYSDRHSPTLPHR